MPVININNLTFGYDGSEKTLFDNVTITLDTSWKLALGFPVQSADEGLTRFPLLT